MAISAQNDEPSYILEVSRKGESVPETSWWSRERMMGPFRVPERERERERERRIERVRKIERESEKNRERE